MLVFAPLISGAIAKLETQLQSRQGPSVLQPYFDIAKFFRKETLHPRTSSPFFEIAPVTAVASYCGIAVLIPILGRDRFVAPWLKRGWARPHDKSELFGPSFQLRNDRDGELRTSPDSR